MECECAETLGTIQPNKLTCSTTALEIIVKVKKTKTLCYGIPIGRRRKELTVRLNSLLKYIKEIHSLIINYKWSKESLSDIQNHLKRIWKVINAVQTIFVVVRSQIALAINTHSDSDTDIIESDSDVLSDQDIFS